MNDKKSQNLKEDIEKPINLDDIICLDIVKDKIKESIILPFQFPQLFQGKRMPQKWTLLCGPSGTGKTYLAKAIKDRIKDKSKFTSITLDIFLNKTLEERIKTLKEIFDGGRKNKPAIIFIDDIDLILNYKKEENEDIKKFKDEFFNEIKNGFTIIENSNIIIFAATSKPWDLDPYVRRRFGKRIYINLPDDKSRILLIKSFIGNNSNNITDEEFNKIENLTKGYSHGDIYNLVQDIIKGSNEKYQQRNHKEKNNEENSQTLISPCITFEDFSLSLQKIKPSNYQNYFEKIEKFQQEF